MSHEEVENGVQNGDLSVDSLKAHYRLLLGLHNSGDVTSVDLNVGSKSVMIALEHRGRGGVCSECKAECGLKARVPRVYCSKCGLKMIAVSWGGKHSRLTLMSEAFAIDVLHVCGQHESGCSPSGAELGFGS
jgi:hypothetical protein